MSSKAPNQFDCEYVVVGSGAGGGTVASRLAHAGRSVVLLEAGGDPRELTGGDSILPDANRLPADYDVPAFHAFASENSAMKWDFYVRHYSDDEQQRLDPKYCQEHDGVLYPRAGTTRRMHRSQRANIDLSPQLRLGIHRGSDTRFQLAAGEDADLLSASGELPAPALASLVVKDRFKSIPPWLGGMATHGKINPHGRVVGQGPIPNAGGVYR